MNQDSNTQRRLELMRLIREENHNKKYVAEKIENF